MSFKLTNIAKYNIVTLLRIVSCASKLSPKTTEGYRLGF